MIILKKMNSEYYTEYYRDYCINELSKQCIENNIWIKEEAKTKAEKEQDEILNQGINTKENYLYIIFNNELKTEIGELWFGKINNEDMEICFLFDLHVKEKYRNNGFGYKAMIEIEKEVNRYGFKRIRLNVFKKNTNAIKLYASCGYKVFNEKENNQWMEKSISE